MEKYTLAHGDLLPDTHAPGHDGALREISSAPRVKYIADFSLSLVNRTGAYFICRDILGQCPELFAAQRYWRLRLRSEPRGLLRRLLARAMLLELAGTRLLPPSRAMDGERTLFLDPLYVLFSGVSARDIVLCHDVGPITMPEAFDAWTARRYGEAYGRIVAARPGMVFVSEASRAAFVSLFGENFRFLEVIPLYTRPGCQNGAEVAPQGLTGPFLLTVGALETRKNHQRSIAAFLRSGLRERGFQYVICGPRGNSAAAVERLVAESQGVRWLGYLSDAELRWAYRHAAGFVLPSLLEGFGLPALEAARSGLIPVISSEGALLEAASGGAILVDPRSIEDIAAGMCRLADMPEAERMQRVALLQEHARSLSLERYIARWSSLLAADLRAH